MFAWKMRGSVEDTLRDSKSSNVSSKDASLLKTNSNGSSTELLSFEPPTVEPNYPLYVGKYNYLSRTDDDLNFKKGDLLYIINTDAGDWWFAKSKQTGQEGYIPCNYVVKYKSLNAEE